MVSGAVDMAVGIDVKGPPPASRAQPDHDSVVPLQELWYTA
jgi:hypothetical protein